MPSIPPWRLHWRASAIEYRSRHYARARELYGRALAIHHRAYGDGHPRLALSLYNLGCLAALEGDKESALDFLRRALESQFRAPILFTDPDLDILRGDPAFEALLDELRQSP